MNRRRPRLTGEAALNARFGKVDHAPLLASLGVEIPEDLLKLALSHRSFANENGNLPNNERLEFLGDAVLGLSIAGKLYEYYPTRPESDISKMRASIVSRYGLADIAREIGLGEFVMLGKGELLTDGSNKDSILADTTEALLGAIYLAHGFEVARDVVLRLFDEKVRTASAVGLHHDWKTALQERLAEYKLSMPVYAATSEGPEHEKLFTATVSVNGTFIGTGQGQSKKVAEQQAARESLQLLNDPEIRNQLILCQNSQK
ncbi:ribonuclease III [Corynebacterium felinum]|uniref:Ribonuclease 3 n=1 Tax=Corynebacterium felinum TaxID=131318 RepID=A0ABU2BBP1_9CORY|nr:ribonuclease III [Corynebacterium felinum]MDF5819810.1 ribonuclease III [Corynebacterium felinum]MDR7356049.1 ribonuclease-3 [Corynebacterium felinum]WJY95384.1 Ribonuclease 3 [Corynebacterium felinum]